MTTYSLPTIYTEVYKNLSDNEIVNLFKSMYSALDNQQKEDVKTNIIMHRFDSFTSTIKISEKGMIFWGVATEIALAIYITMNGIPHENNKDLIAILTTLLCGFSMLSNLVYQGFKKKKKKHEPTWRALQIAKLMLTSGFQIQKLIEICEKIDHKR